MVKPKMLKKGDTVAIVSLSSGVLGEKFVRHEVKLIEKRLTELGLNCKYMPNSRKGLDYIEKHPEARAEDLKTAFSDDSISMIWCALGGNDTFRILPYLMNEEFQELVLTHPKIFMGFSDTTNNHLMFYRLGLNTYYGPALLPDLAEFSPEMLPYTADCIKNLFNNNREREIKSSPVWYKARTSFAEDQVGIPAEEVEEKRGIEFIGPKKIVKGELLGGCLDSLYEMLSFSRFPEEQEKIFSEYRIFPDLSTWQGKLLFIETSEEQPDPQLYKKMIEKLEEYGVYDVVAGVLVGKPMDEKYYDEYKQILTEIAEKYQLPVAFNLNFGHGTPRMILPYGQITELNTQQQKITIKEPFFISELDEKIRKKLYQSVDLKRYIHSLLVAEQAKSLALHYGLNPEKAYTAGLVHDIAKRLSPEEEKYFVEKYRLDPALLTDIAKNYRHSDIGAVVAKEWFDLDDEICQAIKYHTIPNKKMTDYDKIIFLADKIGRNDLPEEWTPLKELAYRNLNEAMIMFLTEQKKDLERRGITPHSGSQEFLDALS